MNRYKKEELKKKDEARKGLTPAEIDQIDIKEAIAKQQFKDAESLHILLFPEEYDFMLDDYVDVNDRKRGINPMCDEYIETIKKKRENLGVPQLTASGMPVDNTTYKLCVAEIRAQQEGKTTEWTDKLNNLKEQILEEKKLK